MLGANMHQSSQSENEIGIYRKDHDLFTIVIFLAFVNNTKQEAIR